MLYDGAFGKSLVSPEFNDMCTRVQVEARVQASANPGNPMRAMRLITFRNFNTTTVKVTQHNKRRQVHIIPAKGELQIMLMPDEQLPALEKGE